MSTNAHIDLSVDLDVLKRELLIALRGKLSQRHISEKLGYSFNQYYRWEVGVTEITWNQFLEILELRKFPIEKFFFENFRFRGNPAEASEMLPAITGETSPQRIAAALGESRYRPSRWLSGVTRLNLVDFLRLLRAYHTSFLEMVLQFVPGGMLPCVSEQMKMRDEMIKVLCEFPFSGALLSCLSHPAIAERKGTVDGWLSEALGVPRHEIMGAMKSLVQKGILLPAPNQASGFLVRPVHVDLKRCPEVAFRVQSYWFSRLGSFAGTQKNVLEDAVAHVIITRIDKQTLAAITDLAREFQLRMIQLMQKEPTPDANLMVFCMGFFDPATTCRV